MAPWQRGTAHHQDLTKRGKDGTGSVKKTVVAPSAAASKRFGNIKFKEKMAG